MVLEGPVSKTSRATQRMGVFNARARSVSAKRTASVLAGVDRGEVTRECWGPGSGTQFVITCFKFMV